MTNDMMNLRALVEKTRSAVRHGNCFSDLPERGPERCGSFLTTSGRKSSDQKSGMDPTIPLRAIQGVCFPPDTSTTCGFSAE